MIVGLLVAFAMAAPAAPPAKAGTRTVAGLTVETNPNWDKCYSATARFGSPYGRGPVSPTAPPRTKPQDLRYRGMTNKFSVNMFNGVVSAPTRDLWVAAPVPVR